MSKKKNLSGTIVEEMIKTVAELGEEKTILAMRHGRQLVANDHNPCLTFVVNTVCRQLNTTIDEIVNEQSHKDTRMYGRGFIVFYLRTHFKMEWAPIKILLKRDQSILYEAGQLIKKLNHMHIHDRPWLDHKKVLDKQMKEFGK
jgi:hypothetical protein